MRRLMRLAPLIATSSFVLSDPPPLNEKVRGIYENKIKHFAPMEKIFETFASEKRGKEIFMTKQDFFEALSPYSFTPARDSNFFDTYDSIVFKMIDANKDGVVSFPEFLFFIILLSAEDELILHFLKENGGQINRDQFSRLMNEARLQSPQVKNLINVSSTMFDPRGVNFDETSFLKNTKALGKYLFKTQRHITAEDLFNLRDLVAEEICFYQFHKFEVGDDECISTEDFAKSIVACINPNKIQHPLKRVEHLGIEGRISFGEFLAFQRILSEAKKLESRFINETQSSKALSFNKLMKVFSEACEDHSFLRRHNLKVSDTQVKVFLKLLDDNDNGFLEPEEFFGIIVTKKNFGLGSPEAPSFKKSLIFIKSQLKAFLVRTGLDDYINL